MPQPRGAGGIVLVGVVLDPDAQQRAGALGADAHRAAVEQVADAVLDGVFHQRLQSIGGSRQARPVADRVLETQARAEAHLFDREEGAHQRNLLDQRDLALRIHAEAAAEEVGQLQGHAARAAGSIEVSALIELRLLNRKCGSIWVRSMRSSASCAIELHSSSRRSSGARALEFEGQVVRHRRQAVQDDAQAEHQCGKGPRHHRQAWCQAAQALRQSRCRPRSRARRRTPRCR
jgi:hypothetical protein